LAGDLAVAVDVGSLIGRPTGVGRFTGELVRALEARDGADRPHVVRYVLSGRATLPPGVIRLPYPARLALACWGHVDHPRAARPLRAAQVVHGTNFVAPPTGKPTVVTVHDGSPLTHPERVDPVVRAFVPVLRRAVSRGAWVHTPSEHVAEQVRELLGATRVRAIPHGAPPRLDAARCGALPDAVAGALGGRPYVLAVGTLEPRKNLPRLVAAFGRMAAAGEVGLVLAGPDGPDAGAVQTAVDALGPERRALVVRTGWVDEPVRERLLAGAVALAYPSLDEGFGLPMLEAFAAGVPVVAAAAGALPEVAGGAALLADPLDVDALAGALATAVTDAATRERLVAAGRGRVGAFAWSTTAASMVELYRDVLSEEPEHGRRR
jgi:glycosyltransferase involved in cell wall biosynthesis